MDILLSPFFLAVYAVIAVLVARYRASRKKEQREQEMLEIARQIAKKQSGEG